MSEENTQYHAAPPPLLGESEALLSVLEQISQAAPLNKPLLVIGERGTGKELIAARLHYLSERWAARLVKLNCAALPEELLESELFGHVPGAFTGAQKPRVGRFSLADGGTLFLDELASMSLRLQEKLLRVLEYGEFERLGSSETQRVNVRVVAAANADLPGLAAQGRFREDLLDRLSFDVITLPPLRARGRDVLLLAQRFGEGMARELGREYFAGFTLAAEAALLSHGWPGNVRELKNVVERAVYRLPSARQQVDQLVLDPFSSPWRLQGSEPSGQGASLAPIARPEPSEVGHKLPCDFSAEVLGLERRLVVQALDTAQQNQTKAAQLLGLEYHQLRNLLKKHALGGQAAAANPRKNTRGSGKAP